MVAQLIDELRAEGAQSDARFAEQLARRRFQTGRGPLKLRAELLAHEIDAALIARVMGEYETQWAALAVEVRRRKFGEQAPTSFRDWAKQARFLQQRGFDASHIEPFAH